MYSARFPSATMEALFTFIIAVRTVTTAWPANESSSDSSPSSSSLRWADASTASRRRGVTKPRGLSRGRVDGVAASQIEIRTLVSAPLVAVVPLI